jgi:hypothetical protein
MVSLQLVTLCMPCRLSERKLLLQVVIGRPGRGRLLTFFLFSLLHLVPGNAKPSAVSNVQLHLSENVRDDGGRLSSAGNQINRPPTSSFLGYIPQQYPSSS